VRFELSLHFAALFHIEQTDLTIAATNSQHLAALVELTTKSCTVTHIGSGNFLHHADIPNFDNAIGIDRADVLATN